MTVTVKHKDEKPVAVEVLAESILEISIALRKLKSGPLNEKALVLLISHASGQPQTVVRAVMSGIESLQKEYLRKP